MDNKTRLKKIISGSKQAEACTRCGGCCKGGAPSLLKEDAALFNSGILNQSHVFTIRDSELVKSHDDNTLYESIELIKVKDKPGTSECIFFGEGNICSIYENRPAQCRQFECWNPAEVLNGLEANRLTREELFAESDAIMEIIRHHEQKCSYIRLKDALDMMAAGEELAVDELIDMLQYDTYARPFIQENFSISPDMFDLILGRPMTQTLESFGFRVMNDGDNYMISTIQEETKE
ncbi:MAG: YkgJ family cysteine cluster protein [Nitrospiraceae bacterium]|nr:YkgJ family cysteine cluster protein [Nitrospiraceae bacterium]